VNFVEILGGDILRIISYLGELSYESARAFKKIFTEKFRRRLVVKHMIEMGIDSLPLVAIVGTFIGMVMVMETALTLRKFGAESYVGGIVSLSMVRELGPVMVALVVAGRVGASIAAELGTMRITEQVDALESLGVDPVGYLVSPRLLAGLIVLPVLNLIADILSIVGGYLVGVYMVHISSAEFWYQSFKYIQVRDLIAGIVKTVVFAFLIVNASSNEGLRASGGAEGVGKATTRAVVNSFFLIILMNLILTAIFYFL